MTFLTIILCI